MEPPVGIEPPICRVPTADDERRTQWQQQFWEQRRADFDGESFDVQLGDAIKAAVVDPCSQDLASFREVLGETGVKLVASDKGDGADDLPGGQARPSAARTWRHSR